MSKYFLQAVFKSNSDARIPYLTSGLHADHVTWWGRRVGPPLVWLSGTLFYDTKTYENGFRVYREVHAHHAHGE